MKRNQVMSYVLCLTLGVSALLWGCAPPQTLDSVEGKFTVLFPAGFPAPKKTSQLVSTAVGDIDVTLFISEKSNGACMAVFNDYPADFKDQADPKTVLDSCRDGAVRQVNGVLNKDEDCSVQNYPGRKIYYSADSMGQHLYGVQLILLADNRLYQIGYVGSNKDSLTSPEIQGFLSSFKITGLETR
ncbi:MAG: hypothetical protein HZA49_01465 [Planctomycetes bacterium]|nr:hypothetical protein [Planctomycetota bacterium]